MRRREFIALLGGTAAAWPLAARAQQPDRVRRIGVLMAYPEDDLEAQAQFAAFRDGLQKLGWMEGRKSQRKGPLAHCGRTKRRNRNRLMRRVSFTFSDTH